MPLHESIQDPKLHGYELLVWPADSAHKQALEFRDQIIAGAHEPEMLMWEPEDALERFASVQSYGEWAEKGRVVVGLTKGDALVGMCYFGKKVLECMNGFNGSVTVGIRMYEQARGRGLALPFFMRAHQVISDYMDIDGLWLSVRSDNYRARHIYEQASYRELADYGKYTLMAYDGTI